MTHEEAAGASVRRLEDADVRAVFECLHEGKPPPRHLPFRIVPVGPNGLKLSPPSHEFPDGLFVLLRPASKGKRNQAPPPRAPPHLRHLVVQQGGDLPMDSCPWSLSGPQFPQPTAIQQRYCYPKGGKDYSSRKGGALWTMYRKDGKEDLTYRLLHVYYSAKRAVNKGGGGPAPSTTSLTDSPAKRLKAVDTQSPGGAAHLSPRGVMGRSSNHRMSPPMPLTPLYSYKSPGVTTMARTAVGASSSLSTTCDSPRIPQAWRQQQPSYPSAPCGYGGGGNFVSPSTPAAAAAAVDAASGYRHPLQWPMGRGALGRQGEGSAAAATAAAARAGEWPVASPREEERSAKCGGHQDDDVEADLSTLEPFPYDGSGENESVGASSDVDWNDARDGEGREALLSGLWLQPSEDAGDDDESTAGSPYPFCGKGDGALVSGGSTARAMAWRLDAVRDALRDAILGSPVPDRCALVGVLVHWARSVASDPLADMHMGPHLGTQTHHRLPVALRRDDSDSLYNRPDGTSIAAV